MIYSKSNQVTRWTYSALLAVATLVIANTATSLVSAQQAFEHLTKENLIGSAVSLSNNDYSEIDKAIQRFRNGDSEGAFAFLESAKQKYPKLPPAEVIFAKMHFAIRNAKASNAGRLLLERTVALNPEDPEAYLLLADQAFAGKRITEAQAIFEMADPLVEKFSGNTKRKKNFIIRVLAGRAAVAESRKQWEESQKWLQKWVETDPESAAAHQRLGSSLFHLQKPKEALAQFQKARTINSDVPHPFITLGQLFSRNNKMEEAQKSFEKAYNEDKNDTTTARSYAEWLIQQDQLDKAQAIAESMLKQTPDSVTALMLDGIIAQMRGETDHAKQSMTKILGIDPSHFTATDLLALLLIQSDKASDQERALKHAQMNAERFSNNPRANITNAWVLHRLGRKAEFQEALKKVGRNQMPVDSAFLIAKIMADMGKKDVAIQELEKLTQKATGLFIFRREAETLLKKLQAE